MKKSVPLNLIVRRETFDFILEGHFVRDCLLGRLGRPVRVILLENYAEAPLIDDCLILSLKLEASDYIRELRVNGVKNIGLLHMGDELIQHDRSFYTYADYVLRNYWSENLFPAETPDNSNCIWVPNGYRTAVGPINPYNRLPAHDRTMFGFFAGAINGRVLSDERNKMAEIVETAALPFTLVNTPGFAGGFGPLSYGSLLSNAVFALIPGGNSPETVRLYDALEAGAIPIMLKSPYVFAPDALNSPPIILLDSWEDLPMVCDEYSDLKSAETLKKLDRIQKKSQHGGMALKFSIKGA